MHSELSLLQLKAGEVEEADSLYFLPAETDGGEGEVEMMETHRDKSKKKKKREKMGTRRNAVQTGLSVG